MPDFKHVLQFAESNGAGFSEVWYSTASDILSSVFSKAMIDARLALLNPLNTLLRDRISSVLGNRVTKIVTYNLPGQPDLAPQIPLPAGAAVVCSISGLAGGSRRWWLRGCDLNDYKRNATTGKDDPAPELDKNLLAFFKAANKNNVGIRVLRGSTPTDNPYIRTTSIDGSVNDGTSVITTAIAHGYQKDDKVIIGLASKKDFPALNGHFSVVAVTATTITIPYRTPLNAGPLKLSARVRKENYAAVSVLDPDASKRDHLGTRSTKNPLSSSRGAKRAARLRTSS